MSLALKKHVFGIATFILVSKKQNLFNLITGRYKICNFSKPNTGGIYHSILENRGKG